MIAIYVRTRWSCYFALSLFSILLAACGGSEGHLSAQGDPAGPVSLYTIGGTVTGLSAGSFIALANNGVDDIVLGGDGTFTFPTRLATGRAYNLSIVTLPVNQPCTHTYGAGTVAGANVDLLNVICGLPPVGLVNATGNLTGPRYSHTATLLPNGKVLVAGGFRASALGIADLYDPVTGTWSATGSLATARYFHTAILLTTGKVLVTGGFNAGTYLASAELYDPATGT